VRTKQIVRGRPTVIKTVRADPHTRPSLGPLKTLFGEGSVHVWVGLGRGR